MNIVFLSGGKREKALRYLAERGETVIAVVTPRLSSQNDRFKDVILTAAEFGITILPVTRNTVTATLQTLKYEILISCGFPYLIDQEAINTAQYAINSHPTLLPKYRGYRSGPYIIINGERESGVSVHFLTPEIDKGEIIAQQVFEVSPFDTTKSLFRKCQEIEPELIHGVIQQIKQGNVRSVPQDEGLASVFNYLRTPKDSEVDWEKPLRDLYNEIRACDPEDYPAFFFVAGQKVCIRLWRPDKPDDETDMI